VGGKNQRILRANHCEPWPAKKEFLGEPTFQNHNQFGKWQFVQYAFVRNVCAPAFVLSERMKSQGVCLPTMFHMQM
jgi:hypothetical protein